MEVYDFVDFSLAVKLKEKGFDYKCLFVYNKEQIINPEIVKAFGELSDDGYCELTKEGGGKLDWSFVYINEYQLIQYRDVLIPRETIKAPTIAQALKWLRNTRELFISPCVITDYQDDFHRDTTYWSFIIANISSGDYIYIEYERVTENRYDSYEQAALAGIEYVLDNLI